MDKLKARLSEAIADRRELAINYKNEGERTVQPHALYRRNDGQVFLDAVQTAGHSSSGNGTGWRQFVLVDIASVSTLGSSFDPAADYDPASNRYRAGLIKGVS